MPTTMRTCATRAASGRTSCARRGAHLNLRHRQVGGFLEAALRWHERAGGEMPAAAIHIHPRAVETSLVERPLEVTDQATVEPFVDQPSDGACLAEAATRRRRTRFG